MMALTAIIPAARLAATNAALEAAGFGPGNFTVPLAATSIAPPTHYALHSWDERLLATLQSLNIPGAVYKINAGFTPRFLTEITAVGLGRSEE